MASEEQASAEGFPPEIRLAESGSNWTLIVIILQPALQGAGKISWLGHITPSGKSDCELKSTKIAVLGMIRKMTPDHHFHCIFREEEKHSQCAKKCYLVHNT